MRSKQEVSYDQYCIAWTLDPNAIQAWGIPTALTKFVKDAKATLEQIAKETQVSLDVLLAAFKSKELFNVFKAVGFSLVKLFSALKAFAALPFKGVMSAIEDLVASDLFKRLQAKTAKVDEVFDKYPILKKLVGPAIAGLLLWLWLNSAFVGDLDVDFDMSYLIQALKGSFSITELFVSADGLSTLAVFALGTFTGLSVPWVASTVGALVTALLFTAAKKVKDTSLVQKLKPLLDTSTIKANSMRSIKTVSHTEASTKTTSVEAGALDAVRASKLLQMLGIKGFELQDASNGYLVFSLHTFMGVVAPLTQFYGTPKNESNAGWATKRLIWSVPEVNGQVMLMQVANATPLLIFKQL